MRSRGTKFGRRRRYRKRAAGAPNFESGRRWFEHGVSPQGTASWIGETRQTTRPTRRVAQHEILVEPSKIKFVNEPARAASAAAKNDSHDDPARGQYIRAPPISNGIRITGAKGDERPARGYASVQVQQLRLLPDVELGRPATLRASLPPAPARCIALRVLAFDGGRRQAARGPRTTQP
jgi:hypothetical protein